MEYLRLTWEDIEKQCEVLLNKIVQSNFKPETIVGVARGGWMPARILSDMLDIHELYSMRVRFYTSIDQRARAPTIVYPVPVSMKSKRVLLVDDIADTGESLKLARRHLKENGAEEILTVTLVKKPRSKVTPDFFVVETAAWVVFPWEVSETIRSIIENKQEATEYLRELESAGIKDTYLRRKQSFRL